MKEDNEIAEVIKQIRQDAVEKYQRTHGWIPITEAVPPNSDDIILSFAGYESTAVGRYEEDEEGGTFYLNEDDIACSNYGIFVNAWMPFPKGYCEE